jgi:hypothetical protein
MADRKQSSVARKTAVNTPPFRKEIQQASVAVDTTATFSRIAPKEGLSMSTEPATEAMNWVDYCDALRNEDFANRPPRRWPLSGPDTVPDHVAFVASLQDVVREVR